MTEIVRFVYLVVSIVILCWFIRMGLWLIKERVKEKTPASFGKALIWVVVVIVLCASVIYGVGMLIE